MKLGQRPTSRRIDAGKFAIYRYTRRMGTLYYGDNLDILKRYLKDELMEGKNIERPSNVAALDETFKKAPKSKVKDSEQTGLNL